MGAPRSQQEGGEEGCGGAGGGKSMTGTAIRGRERRESSRAEEPSSRDRRAVVTRGEENGMTGSVDTGIK